MIQGNNQPLLVITDSDNSTIRKQLNTIEFSDVAKLTSTLVTTTNTRINGMQTQKRYNVISAVPKQKRYNTHIAEQFVVGAAMQRIDAFDDLAVTTHGVKDTPGLSNKAIDTIVDYATANGYRVITTVDEAFNVLCEPYTVDTVTVDDDARIVVIGDVQSCANPLKRVLENHPISDHKNVYVFTGDLFDRGGDPVGVLESIESLPQNRTFLIRGNHELNLRPYLNQRTTDAPGAIKATRTTMTHLVEALGDEAFDRVRALYDRTHIAVKLNRGSETFLFCHGGIRMDVADLLIKGYLPRGTRYVNPHMFIYGHSTRESSLRGSTTYDADMLYDLLVDPDRKDTYTFTQVFGHREMTVSSNRLMSVCKPVEKTGELGHVVL